MKTNAQVNPKNTIYNLLGVVEALRDLIETKQVLLKQSIPVALRRLYEKQIFATSYKIDYLEDLIKEAKEEMELKSKSSEQEMTRIEQSVSNVFNNFRAIEKIKTI